RKNVIDKQLYWRLYSTSSSLATMYGQPKVHSRAPRDESCEIPRFSVRPCTTISLRSSVYFIFGNMSIICQRSFPSLIEKATRCEIARKESHRAFLDGMYYVSSAKG